MYFYAEDVPEFSPHNNLKFFRKKLGFSQKDVARMMGQNSHGEVSRHETGAKDPGFVAMLKYEHLYNVPGSVLFPEQFRHNGDQIDAEIRNWIGELEAGGGQPRKLERLQRMLNRDVTGDLVPVVLAIEPTIRGFGYAILRRHPITLLDWGGVDCRGGDLKKCLKKIEQLIADYVPVMLVLPDTMSKGFRGGSIARALIRKSRTFAKAIRLKVRIVGHEEVSQFFRRYGATNKEEIAKIIVGQFSFLEDRLPKPRNAGDPERYSASVFDAVALGLAVIKLTV